MSGIFYISFATDEGFRGVAVVSADDEVGALAETNRLGINPGGEAAILALPPNMDDAGKAEMLSYRDRLVGKEELLANGAKRCADLPQYMQDRFEEEATRVCADCN